MRPGKTPRAFYLKLCFLLLQEHSLCVCIFYVLRQHYNFCIHSFNLAELIIISWVPMICVVVSQVLQKKYNMKAQRLVTDRTARNTHKTLLKQYREAQNSAQGQMIYIQMLKSFRKEEINIIWSDWRKKKSTNTVRPQKPLKSQAQGIALYSIDNGKLFGNTLALSKHLVGRDEHTRTLWLRRKWLNKM